MPIPVCDHEMMIEASLPVTGSYDLRGTLRPLHGSFRDDGWWLTDRTPEGPATLQVVRTREEIVGRAWGSGAGHLLDRLPDIVGASDDPSLFATEHPIVAPLHRRHQGVRLGRTFRVFPELVIAVTGQKVTGAEAHRAMSALQRRFSATAPGPRADLVLPPDPTSIAQAPYWEFHELHIEKKRADLLRRIAADRERIGRMAEVEVSEATLALAAYPGIGPWTVAETLLRSHGDPDAVSVGDYHLKNMVVFHLTGRSRGSDEEMVELLEEFRPHRARVVRLLHSLGHAPKFGPRSTPRNISSM